MTRVLIFGTGALACGLGGRLAGRAGATVTLAGTWREAIDAIRRDGIRVHDEAGSWSVPADALPLADLPPADIALVLVKAYQTEALVPFARRAVEAGALLVTLQNGLGPLAILQDAVGPSFVAGGVATLGATLLGPGEVRVHPGGVVLGEADTDPADPRLRTLALLLTVAGFPTEVTQHLDTAVWTKLAVNCAINPLTALTGLANGALLSHPRLGALMTDAAREVAAVARARGIVLEDDPVARAMDVARTTAANRSSMLQDLERGSLTEIDALCGAVVREARRLAVPVPTNEWLWREVKAREGARGPRRIPA